MTKFLALILLTLFCFSEISAYSSFHFEILPPNETVGIKNSFAGGEGRRGRRIGPSPKHPPKKRTGAEHQKGKRKSTKDKHERGSSRKKNQEDRSNKKSEKKKKK